MTVGQGLAIIGVWLFPVACSFSKYVNNSGWNRSIVIAVVMTWWLSVGLPWWQSLDLQAWFAWSGT